MGDRLRPRGGSRNAEVAAAVACGHPLGAAERRRVRGLPRAVPGRGPWLRGMTHRQLEETPAEKSNNCTSLNTNFSNAHEQRMRAAIAHIFYKSEV